MSAVPICFGSIWMDACQGLKMQPLHLMFLAFFLHGLEGSCVTPNILLRAGKSPTLHSKNAAKLIFCGNILLVALHQTWEDADQLLLSTLYKYSR